MKNWNFEMLQPAHGGVTEGPAWDGSGLLFTRIQQSRIMRYDPAGGPLRLPLRLPAPPRARNTAALSSSAATWNTRIALHWEENEEVIVLRLTLDTCGGAIHF